MYHVRYPNGVTADWVDYKSDALRFANDINAEVYEVHANGAAFRIRSVKR